MVGVAVILAGCGAAKPSSDEAKTALMTRLKHEGAPISDIKNFSLDGCVKAKNADGVNCDVKGTPILSMMGRQAEGAPFASSFRFKKGDGGWEAFP